MMGRRMGRGGRPGLIGVAARTAVIAGTATAVSGHVAQHQAQKAQAAQAGQQAAAAPPPEVPAEDDVYAQLEKLAALNASGVLSDDEFAAAKAKLLGI